MLINTETKKHDSEKYRNELYIVTSSWSNIAADVDLYLENKVGIVGFAQRESKGVGAILENDHTSRSSVMTVLPDGTEVFGSEARENISIKSLVQDSEYVIVLHGFNITTEPDGIDVLVKVIDASTGKSIFAKQVHIRHRDEVFITRISFKDATSPRFDDSLPKKILGNRSNPTPYLPTPIY